MGCNPDMSGGFLLSISPFGLVWVSVFGMQSNT